MTTAPDGTLYIVDMYRGIIQEGQWTKPGTYLRKKIEQYQLDKVVRHGRIWRLTYDGMARDRTRPRDVERDVGTTGRASEPSQRVVAGHRAAAARAQAGRIGAARTDPAGPPLAKSCTRAFMRCGRSKAWERSTPRSCASRWKTRARRCASRRSAPARRSTRPAEITRRRLPAAVEGSGRRRGDSGAVDAEPFQGVRLQGDRHGRSGRQQRARRPGNRTADSDARQYADRWRPRPPPFTPDGADTSSRGEGIYKELCFSCHGDDGRGTPEPGAPQETIDGAAVGGIAARAGTSRLRDQDAPARHDRSARRQDRTRPVSWCRWAPTPTSGSRRLRRTCATVSATPARS